MCNGEQLLCCVCRLLNGTSHLDPFRKAMMEFLSVRIIDGSAQKCISFEKWGEFIEIQFGSRGSTPGVKNESVVIRRCQMTQKTPGFCMYRPLKEEIKKRTGCEMCQREQRRAVVFYQKWIGYVVGKITHTHRRDTSSFKFETTTDTSLTKIDKHVAKAVAKTEHTITCLLS